MFVKNVTQKRCSKLVSLQNTVGVVITGKLIFNERKKQMKNNGFPTEIYVKIENDDDDDYLVAGTAPSEISVSENSIRVGVYDLVEIRTATNKTVLED